MMNDYARTLYKAVKYQVAEYFADHGYTMPRLWAIVSGKIENENKTLFWRNQVMADYYTEVLGK